VSCHVYLNVLSALEIVLSMCYINVHFTYLLTYLLTWQLLSAITAGFESSSTVCRTPSGAEIFEADLSLSHLLSGGLLADPSWQFPAWRFTACLVTLATCTSHTDWYPYPAISYQRSINFPGMVLQVPIIKDGFYESSGKPMSSSGSEVHNFWVIRITQQCFVTFFAGSYRSVSHQIRKT